jgi:hypothetical protein
MGIPKGITREHVEQAMQQLNEGIDHPFGESVGYDLWYEGRTYAPKAVVALAAKSATGASLGPHDFSGGEGGGWELQDVQRERHRAPTRWDNADPCLEHPYLVRKHVAAVVAHEPEAEPRQGEPLLGRQTIQPPDDSRHSKPPRRPEQQYVFMD